MTFLVIDGNRHWLSISNYLKINIKVKALKCPDDMKKHLILNIKRKEKKVVVPSNS